ncbi:hypothetical protein C8F01DRAFT_1332883 [Mycena amicta]|nr:hypothetical protein C8F01DRAFT_1332883 [Mycena amicta]
MTLALDHHDHHLYCPRKQRPARLRRPLTPLESRIPIASERTDGTDGMTALTVATGCGRVPDPENGLSHASQHSGRLQGLLVPRSASFEAIVPRNSGMGYEALPSLPVASSHPYTHAGIPLLAYIHPLSHAMASHHSTPFEQYHLACRTQRCHLSTSHHSPELEGEEEAREPQV